MQIDLTNGVQPVIFPTRLTFDLDDLVLILQTKTMWENLNRYGNRMISIDATHNTTRFAFKLITCFVVEPNSNRGLPVLFTISTGESRKCMKAVFSMMKVGNNSPYNPLTAAW
jgi:hypothetical protein